MVAIISSFKSLRFRLFFTIVLVVFALAFENSFLIDTQNLQDDIQEKGNLYLEQDIKLIEDLDRIGILLDSLITEQISSFLVDIYFEASLDEITSDDTVRELKALTGFTSGALEKRENNRYLIEAESSNQLFVILPTYEKSVFDESIIDSTDGGANNLYQNYLEQFVFTNQTDTQAFLPDELKTVSNDIRASHNSFIRDITLNNETVERDEGAFVKLGFLFDKAISLLTEETNQTKSDEIRSLLDEGESQITDYVFNIVEFENAILRNKVIVQTDKIIAINDFTSSLENRSNSIVSIYQNIIELTNSVNLTETIDLTLTIFTHSHNAALKILQNNGIQIGSFVAETKVAIFQVDAVLVKEQLAFEEGYENFLNDLQSNLQTQIQFTFIIVILITGIFIASISLTLVRFFSRYENNYKKIEEGNLSIPLRSAYGNDELGRVDRGFDNMIVELKRILSALQRSSERMAGIAEELAAGAEEASASVQEVSNTVREFSSGAAEQNIMLSRIDVKLSDHLKTIEDATTQINETSNFVLKVAKRTNILGLNASIEAAKAGRFGLGFNVVAEEVRNLSDDTKASALEIAGLIENIETKIKTTVRDILHEVNITKEVAENTAAGSEEANAATSEQVVMLNEISQTSNELSVLANELQQILSRFAI